MLDKEGDEWVLHYYFCYESGILRNLPALEQSDARMNWDDFDGPWEEKVWNIPDLDEEDYDYEDEEDDN